MFGDGGGVYSDDGEDELLGLHAEDSEEDGAHAAEGAERGLIDEGRVEVLSARGFWVPGNVVRKKRVHTRGAGGGPVRPLSRLGLF